MNYSEKEKAELLSLSRKALEYYFNNKEEYIPQKNSISKRFYEKRATFVTLTKEGKLRGCVGMLEAIKPLYEDIVDNTYNAAFYDNRFERLKKEELSQIKIEISVLSIPEELTYKNSNDLINVLNKTKPGLIIKAGYYQSTFLPQVWEDLPNPDEFLSHLCMKAGLEPFYWKENRLEIYKYEVEHFGE